MRSSCGSRNAVSEAKASTAARNRAAAEFTCAGVRAKIPGEAWTGVGGCGLGKIPGTRAELKHGSGGAWALRIVVATRNRGAARGGAAQAS